MEIDVYDENGKPVLDKNGKPVKRRYDAINHKTQEWAEFKSGGAHDSSQGPKDRAILRDPRLRAYTLRMVFGQELEKAPSA